MVPQFQSIAAFLAMGGNGGFVFSAWGLSIFVIFILIGRSIVTGRRQKARLVALEKDSAS